MTVSSGLRERALPKLDSSAFLPDFPMLLAKQRSVAGGIGRHWKTQLPRGIWNAVHHAKPDKLLK